VFVLRKRGIEMRDPNPRWLEEAEKINLDAKTLHELTANIALALQKAYEAGYEKAKDESAQDAAGESL
jgi:hypothetical protein